MRSTRLLVLAAVALGASAVPAQARTPSLPVLAATTVVTTTGSGYVDVEVPADARLSPRREANPDVSITGSGRLLGVFLQPLEDGNDSLDVVRLPGFLGGRTRTSGTAEPEPVCTGLANYTCTAPPPTAFVLHRGRYRLTVLGDGHPIVVSLRLRGLSGTTSLRPAHALASTQLPLPARESVGDKHLTYGGTGPLTGSLRTFVLASATTTGAQLDGWSVCARRDAATTAPFAYSTACPGSTQGGYAMSLRQGSYGVYGSWFGGLEQAGPVGLGGSFTNDGGVRLGQTLGVWLRMP